MRPRTAHPCSFRPRANWHGLAQLVTGAVRQQTVQTAEERPADRLQTAITADHRPSTNGSDGGQDRAESFVTDDWSWGPELSR